MYTIIGGDGREYGPVTAEQVRSWIGSGRANLETKAKALGTDEWKRLGDFPAFDGRGEPPVVDAVPDDASGLAARWARLGAALVDGLLYLFCLAPLMNPAFIDTASQSGYSFKFADAINLAGADGRLKPAAWMILILVLAQILLLSLRGQSLGKLLFRIRIARLGSGRNPGFGRAVLLRWFLPSLIGMVPILGMCFMIVDVCFIFRNDRRCLHDLIADTAVVRN